MYTHIVSYNTAMRNWHLTAVYCRRWPEEIDQ